MTKKNFLGALESPAASFITTPAGGAPARRRLPQEDPAVPAEPQSEASRYVERRELKTRRVQLLLQPSVYNRLKAIARQRGVSVNELCNEFLSQASLRALKEH
ncbi:hypothetical protein MAF45_05965 [Mesosutterella sp. OilRF-GAM-744-9]|uniref:Toxin-antitoxin system HicB family antitoxin n=1 Tax=Mesosutterella porci TaxID=2915351 RepID=A0ABS9MR48_9BURK|nr:hypothetical protein [Mesosutterella sp. oilRF-744-WT-GAM-9]MCG5030992.1 hypothetical protein [Mesosutterella sp. oilRF-744-WT-GAM-9]MCI6530278.1 hypothetical protein [Mesosutterella sp.]